METNEKTTNQYRHISDKIPTICVNSPELCHHAELHSLFSPYLCLIF